MSLQASRLETHRNASQSVPLPLLFRLHSRPLLELYISGFYYKTTHLNSVAGVKALEMFLFLGKTMRLHHLLGGSAGPRYSLFRFYKQEKN